MNKKAIVTGATGSIGNALILELIENSYEVYAVCRPGSARLDSIPEDEGVHVLEADLSKLVLLKDQLPKCDSFFHLGWTGTDSWERNHADLQNVNIGYTLDAAELAAHTGCKVFVGVGSQAEYGRIGGKIGPDTPTFPEIAYGAAKLCAGQLSRIKCAQNGIRHIWARVFSVYGPYDSKHTMIGSAVQKLLEGQTPEFTEGGQLWDYLYYRDAGKMLFELSRSGKGGAVYCLGSGETRKISEYITILRDQINPELQIKLGAIPYAPNQIMYLCADISETLKDTGIQELTSYEDGICEYIRVIKENSIE